jgi:DNA-binding NarL/FixJ family response regulator
MKERKGGRAGVPQRILICSHDASLREQWRKAVGSVSGLLVRQAVSRRGLVAKLPRKGKALVLLDLRLPGLDDGDGIEALLAMNPSLWTLAVSPAPSDREGMDLIHLGVRGYLPLDAPGELVAEAVGVLLAGEIWFSRHLLSLAIYECFDSPHRWHRIPPDVRTLGLTPRQQVVALLVADGLSNKEIAEQLEVNEGTVKAHLSAIFERAGVHNRTALARLMNAASDDRAGSQDSAGPAQGNADT